jgi:hypothetical protein
MTSGRNWSLTTTFYLAGQVLSIPCLSSRVTATAIAFGIVSTMSLPVMTDRANRCRFARSHAEYALFVASIPLLSPICWSHYFVVLLLPLAVLAKDAIREGRVSWSVWGLVGLVLVLALPDTYLEDVVPFVMEHASWRLSVLLARLPSFALLGLFVWTASLNGGAGETNTARRRAGRDTRR